MNLKKGNLFKISGGGAKYDGFIGYVVCEIDEGVHVRWFHEKIMHRNLVFTNKTGYNISVIKEGPLPLLEMILEI